MKYIKIVLILNLIVQFGCNTSEPTEASSEEFNRFVAVGMGGTGCYSDDGVKWISSSHNNGDIQDVTFGKVK